MIRTIRSGAASQLAGYVMAGGGSTRFGRDKALVEIGGVPMLGRMIGLLRSVTEDVRVVAGQGDYGKFGAEIVADRWPREGPLGGIITALEATAQRKVSAEWNLILSCDMPFLTAEWLRFLVQRAESSPAEVVLPRSSSGPEPLCACWRTTAAGPLDQAF